MQLPENYRVVVVCTPGGLKATSLILGNREIARSVEEEFDPLGDDKITVTRSSLDCSICHHKFNDIQSLGYHLSVDHSYSYKCSYCLSSFPTETALQIHLKSHGKNLSYDCKICDKKYIKLETFDLHMIREHNTVEQKFMCENCDRGFQLKSDLITHIKNTHKPQKCQLCKQIVNDIKKHMKDNHEENNNDSIEVTCSFRKQKFTSKKKFELHKKKHRNGINIKCKECNCIFPSERSLVNHRDREHKLTTKCEICKKNFYSTTNYYQHILLHAKIKPYTCDICGEKFSQRRGCKKHRESHSGEHPPFEEKIKIAHLARKYLDSLNL